MVLPLDLRRRLIGELRLQAEAQNRAMGCTCEPTWTLSERTFGPLALPMWESDHADDCAAAQALGEREALFRYWKSMREG